MKDLIRTPTIMWSYIPNEITYFRFKCRHEAVVTFVSLFPAGAHDYLTNYTMNASHLYTTLGILNAKIPSSILGGGRSFSPPPSPPVLYWSQQFLIKNNSISGRAQWATFLNIRPLRPLTVTIARTVTHYYYYEGQSSLAILQSLAR